MNSDLKTEFTEAEIMFQRESTSARNPLKMGVEADKAKRIGVMGVS